MGAQLDDSPEVIIERLRRQVDGLQRNVTWRAEREERLRAELQSVQSELARARADGDRPEVIGGRRLNPRISQLKATMRRLYPGLRNRLRKAKRPSSASGCGGPHPGAARIVVSRRARTSAGTSAVDFRST